MPNKSPTDIIKWAAAGFGNIWKNLPPYFLPLAFLTLHLTACSNSEIKEPPRLGSRDTPTETTAATAAATIHPTPAISPQADGPGKGDSMDPVPILVPEGRAPMLDGIHSPSEWEGAAVESFADGSELLLMHADRTLYLGIQGIDNKMIAANVFIQSGDEILILHSSAALGTAIYKVDDGNWVKAQDFSWKCRKTSLSEEALAERETFLQDEGWVAANALMGTPNELEYQIKLPEGDFRLAVVYIKSVRPYEKVPWPPGLDDACLQQTPNGLPDVLEFSPDQWQVLQFINSE